MTKMMIL